MRIQLSNASEYGIAWVSALPIERAAALAVLDEEHEPPSNFVQAPRDDNAYAWGKSGKHNIVIVTLPAGQIGVVSAAVAASQLLSSLPLIKFGLMVGIGGGLPREGAPDIRLGDVVVSQPSGLSGGVVQYDSGKMGVDGLKRCGTLNKPPRVLLNAVNALKAEQERFRSNMNKYFEDFVKNNPSMIEVEDEEPGYGHQGVDADRLFQPTYCHVSGRDCENCNSRYEISRKPRKSLCPRIHYGTIASGFKLFKNDVRGDNQFLGGNEGYLCVEMEAAGLMDSFPCIVVRGISDYADTHKNKRWQRYAAITASIYTKDLLEHVALQGVKEAEKAVELVTISRGLRRLELEAIDIKDRVHNHYVFDLSKQLKETIIQLPIAQGASFDSAEEAEKPRCLEHTRIEILSDIMSWAESPNAKTVFWLKGLAGTGKSTIARTIASKLKISGTLGASFFFKKGESDRGTLKKFFTTIAAQLAYYNHRVAHFIQEAINQEHNQTDIPFREQYHKLVLMPLKLASHETGNLDPVIIVIDALDECENSDIFQTEKDIKSLIDLFLHEKTRSINLRVFITSRLEPAIRGRFNSHKGEFDDFALHEVPQKTIREDLSLFIRHRTNGIRESWNEKHAELEMVLPEWPSPSHLSFMVEESIPLFIFAETLCRFIENTIYNPQRRLDLVLKGRSKGNLQGLNSLYMSILDRVTLDLDHIERGLFMEDFHLIMGVIVTLAEPVTIECLAGIVDREISDLRAFLNSLHAVLDTTSDAGSPVRLLHLSFRDFILSPDIVDNDYSVNEEASRVFLATRCLHLMDQLLRKDICSVIWPGAAITEETIRQANKHIPLHLQYSCRYWITHTNQVHQSSRLISHIYEFMGRHFLHLVETLCLLGGASNMSLLIENLQALQGETDDQHLTNFLADAIFWIRINLEVISSTPLQIYSSGTLRPPLLHEGRNLLSSEKPDWISSIPALNLRWGNPGLETIHRRGETSTIVTSEDSKLIGTIHNESSKFSTAGKVYTIWSTNTGGRLHKFTLNQDEQYCPILAFANDSSMLAIATRAGSVMVRETDTELPKHIFNAHVAAFPGQSTTGCRVRDLSFSPNSEFVAALCLVDADFTNSTIGAGRAHATIVLCNITTGEERLITLRMHQTREKVLLSSLTQVHGLAFTTDSAIIKIWSEVDEDHNDKMESSSEEIPDRSSTRIFIGEFCTLTGVQVMSFQLSFPLWEKKKETSLWRVEHKPPIFFSQNLELVAFQSKSEECQLLVMEVKAGTIKLKLPVSAISAAFSIDGSILVIYSIRRFTLWSMATGTEIGALDVIGLDNFRLEDDDFVLFGAPTIQNRTVMIPLSVHRGFYFWRFHLDQYLIPTVAPSEIKNNGSTQIQPGCFLGGSMLGQLLVVITGQTDGTAWLNLFRSNHLELRKMLKGVYPPNPWIAMNIVFCPKGKHAAGQWGQRNLTVWCMENGECTLEIPFDQPAVYAFSWDSELIAIWNGEQRAIFVYQLETSETISTIDLSQDQSVGTIDILLFSRDDQQLIIATKNGPGHNTMRLLVWQRDISQLRLMYSHMGRERVTGLAFLPNAKFLAVSVDNNDLSKYQKRNRFTSNTGRIWIIDISSGTLLYDIETTTEEEEILSYTYFERISHQGFLSRFSEYPLLAWNGEEKCVDNIHSKPYVQISRALEHMSGTDTWVEFFGKPFLYLATNQEDLVQPQIFPKFVSGNYIVLSIGGRVLVITVCLEKLWNLMVQSGMRFERNFINNIPRLRC